MIYDPLYVIIITQRQKKTADRLFFLYEKAHQTNTQRNEEQLKYWGNLFAHINFYLARQQYTILGSYGNCMMM